MDMDERDLPRLEAELYGLRILLARRQEAVANLSQRVAEKEAEISVAKRALHLSTDGPPPRRYGAIREMIMRLLQSRVDGMGSADIGRELQAWLEGDIGSKTHLNTLKRLEAEGLARRAGRVWTLTSEGHTALERRRTGK
jgi:Ribonuclease R winged-helix domain